DPAREVTDDPNDADGRIIKVAGHTERHKQTLDCRVTVRFSPSRHRHSHTWSAIVVRNMHKLGAEVWWGGVAHANTRRKRRISIDERHPGRRQACRSRNR